LAASPPPYTWGGNEPNLGAGLQLGNFVLPWSATVAAVAMVVLAGIVVARNPLFGQASSLSPLAASERGAERRRRSTTNFCKTTPN
jgi:hypothetical protein